MPQLNNAEGCHIFLKGLMGAATGFATGFMIFGITGIEGIVLTIMGDADPPDTTLGDTFTCWARSASRTNFAENLSFSAGG